MFPNFVWLCPAALTNFAANHLFRVSVCFCGLYASHKACFTNGGMSNKASLTFIFVQFCRAFSRTLTFYSVWKKTVEHCERGGMRVVGNLSFHILFDLAQLRWWPAVPSICLCFHFFLSCAYLIETVLWSASPMWGCSVKFCTSISSLFLLSYFVLTQKLAFSLIGIFALLSQASTCRGLECMRMYGWHDDMSQVKKIHFYMFSLWLNMKGCQSFTCVLSRQW